eukprot:CAMPEP_0119377720 /NCGR_PEP_ID=MMETSP1334-20130426/46334_1 /TAXON_ID=127549 /ORGANISM="Calcidiscus leptoporus, Strain RCC1130" /LENGTH=232 /DNA_ID=CAMNT_0007396725 /DNA_START=65 /DNA_END=763 /DNA_ORIENTATION=-
MAAHVGTIAIAALGHRSLPLVLHCHSSRALPLVAMQASTDILWLGDYPFYTVQPTAGMDAAFARNSERVRAALGADEVLSISRVGSSAVVGMPGTPVVDMVAVCKAWPPTASQLDALNRAGFDDRGLAPHAEDDRWFYGGDEGAAPGTLGRCVVHVVREGNPWTAEAEAFVAYVSAVPKAFAAYSEVKLEGARLAVNGRDGMRLSEYKQRKHKVCMRVLREAQVWARKQAAR